MKDMICAGFRGLSMIIWEYTTVDLCIWHEYLAVHWMRSEYTARMISIYCGTLQLTRKYRSVNLSKSRKVSHVLQPPICVIHVPGCTVYTTIDLFRSRVTGFSLGMKLRLSSHWRRLQLCAHFCAPKSIISA